MIHKVMLMLLQSLERFTYDKGWRKGTIVKILALLRDREARSGELPPIRTPCVKCMMDRVGKTLKTLGRVVGWIDMLPDGGDHNLNNGFCRCLPAAEACFILLQPH